MLCRCVQVIKVDILNPMNFSSLNSTGVDYSLYFNPCWKISLDQYEFPWWSKMLCLFVLVQYGHACDEQKCAGKVALVGRTNMDLLIVCVYTGDQICWCMLFFFSVVMLGFGFVVLLGCTDIFVVLAENMLFFCLFQNASLMQE